MCSKCNLLIFDHIWKQKPEKEVTTIKGNTDYERSCNSISFISETKYKHIIDWLNEQNILSVEANQVEEVPLLW